MENDNDTQPGLQYDGNELLKVVEDQRNSALNQAAQLSAVIVHIRDENKKLQRENDSLRERLGDEVPTEPKEAMP